MKKFVVGVAVALATLIMCMCLAGCGSGLDSLKKKYEEAGYTCEIEKAPEDEIKELEDLIASMEDGEEKDAMKKALDIAKKSEALNVSKDGKKVAQIVYVPNVDDYKEMMGETAWNAAEKAGFVKGNLVYSPVGVDNVAFEIFKNN